MPIYTFRCADGHEVDEFFKVSEKPNKIQCKQCGEKAEGIINCTQRNGCWPEGRVFENVGKTPRTFKSYSEMDRYLTRNHLATETLSPAQLKVRQEERRHKIECGVDPRVKVQKKKKQVPEKIDRAFRECPTVETAIRALKEGRV